jgi:hypothetical protein
LKNVKLLPINRTRAVVATVGVAVGAAVGAADGVGGTGVGVGVGVIVGAADGVGGTGVGVGCGVPQAIRRSMISEKPNAQARNLLWLNAALPLGVNSRWETGFDTFGPNNAGFCRAYLHKRYSWAKMKKGSARVPEFRIFQKPSGNHPCGVSLQS